MKSNKLLKNGNALYLQVTAYYLFALGGNDKSSLNDHLVTSLDELEFRNMERISGLIDKNADYVSGLAFSLLHE